MSARFWRERSVGSSQSVSPVQSVYTGELVVAVGVGEGRRDRSLETTDCAVAWSV